MLMMIDNYDSFTFNLVQYLQELGTSVEVHRNDQIDVDSVIRAAPQQLMISPGPGTPDSAGVSMATIEAMANRVPILGVCLGHQSIAQVYGGKIIPAKEIMHGKLSMIHHNNSGVFAGQPSPFQATRYHSLVIEQSSLPACLEISAWTENDDGSIEEIMAIRHTSLAIEGVQFHPESIMSEHGHALLKNFLDVKM